MTAIHDIATKLTAAVVDRIDTDRCCNTANIGDAILKELAVAALTPIPGNSRTASRLITAAHKMLDENRSHHLVGGARIASCFDDAHRELESALREIEAL